jgi:HSP20 family protein
MVNVNRWSPFDEVFNFQRQLDRVFNQFWTDLPSRTASSAGAFQVHTKEDGWQIDVPMPGIDPEHVNVEVAGNTLHIRVEQPSERNSNARTPAYEQTLTVPPFLDLDKLSAAHRHGMLQLTLPLKESVKPRRIEIAKTAEDRRQLTTA